MHFIKHHFQNYLLHNIRIPYYSKKWMYFFFFLFSQILFSQTQKKEIELLQNESFTFLEEKYWKSVQNKNAEEKYAEAYILKGKKEKDTTEISNGYYMMIYAKSYEKSKNYIDSIIEITKNNINYYQPAKVYLLKATDYGNKGNYVSAFKSLKKAENSAIISGNKSLLFEIKYINSRLKTDIGSYEESNKILKEVMPYTKEKGNIRSQIISSWAIGNNYNLLKQPDSALKITEKIIPLSLKTRDSVIYYKLLLSTAISYYDKENYQASLDSIFKIKKLYDTNNYNYSIDILINLYLAKNYLKQNKTDLGVNFLKKVDTISTSNSYYHSSIRENYSLLYDYYKEKKDVKNQLLYINKLLKTDSILDNDFSYMLKNTTTQVISEQLNSEKEAIIKSLKKDDYQKKVIVAVLLLFSGVLLIILFKNNTKRKLYKNHLKKLSIKKKDNSHKIDIDIKNRILEGLKEIEETKQFLESDFNLAYLSKNLKTNTSYLSKIINESKKTTFKHYLVDLRIKYLIEQLDENPILRKYSIEALAASIGYTNASSFTRIFKKYAGVSPSKFLKEKYATKNRLESSK